MKQEFCPNVVFYFPWHHSTNSDSTARACLMLWKDFVWPKSSEFGWWCMTGWYRNELDEWWCMADFLCALIGGAWLVDIEMKAVSGGAWQIFWWCMTGWSELLTGWFVLLARQVTRNEVLGLIIESCMAVFGWWNGYKFANICKLSEIFKCYIKVVCQLMKRDL